MTPWITGDDVDANDLPDADDTFGEWYRKLVVGSVGGETNHSAAAQRAIDGIELAEEYRHDLLDSLYTDAVSEAVETLNERLEYEVRGAWRAGYDYLHVYNENPLSNISLGETPLEDGVTFTQYVYPSDSDKPRLLEHDGIVYRYSYDLTSVDDEVLRRAIRGDLDIDELREAGDE